MYQQTLSKGKVQTDEILQFATRGIPIQAALAQALGVSQARMSELVQAGTVGSEALVKAFELLADSGGKFAGIMAKQSQTVTGLFSTMQDGFEASAKDVYDKINPALVETLSSIGQATEAAGKQSNALSNNQNSFLVLLLILFFTFLTFAAIVPGTHTFEGNIIAQQMSFVYIGEESKLFLQDIRGIKELENQGKQTLTFTGNFQSETWPEINKLDSLKIQLKDSDSRWIVASANPQDTSEISINELRLQPNTKITGLSYDFYRNQLAFSLQPNSNLNQKINPNTLGLDLGGQPIEVIVEGYELLDFKLPNQPDNQIPLEFIVNQNNKKINLEITQQTSIDITVAKTPKYESE
ncbi:MAG: tape measure protein [Nostoc sp.]|uniref:tape measure protein n=1 Tax=Nostoc sp. TaxID=1180 RepID=UPI002FF54B2C